ncbi:hypothetical protein MKW94_012115 [Papaver nudicaule]|uniref:Ribosome biogenesis protein slx9-like n=1 Tax=Papaver nudicaule TaxID=74823 RepID=A0AA41S069_PAPNU|nr:hypothetical protein [Papaver nudicaule]
MGLTGLRPTKSKDKAAKKEQKFEKKVDFYSKVKDKVASLSANKTIAKKKKLRPRQKKLKAYDLTLLTEFLPEVKNPNQQAASISLKLDCKSRQKLVQKETKQFKTVLNNAVFQMDPLAAIQKHLENTQPPQVEKPKERLKKNGSKKKKSKTSSVAQSMDI